MREIIEQANKWRKENRPIALATVIKTWGSAPRKVGAKMIVSNDNAMAGSVSGGCVEGAVVEAAQNALAENHTELLEFGVADETAWTVGLACGGMIDVFVEPFDQTVQEIVSGWIANEQAGAVTTVIGGFEKAIGRKILLQNDEIVFDSYESEIYRQMILYATRRALANRKSTRYLVPDSNIEIFIDVIMPSPTLIIIGGVHIAQALIEIGQVVGFRAIVIDPRRAFGSIERFPAVPLHQEWPRKAFEHVPLNAASAVVLLTHDPKIDDQALEKVLPSKAFYIGALGSSKTAAKRVKRLEEGGFSAEQTARIHGPVGLDINAKTPEEIALAIMGEIIAAYRR